MTAIFQLKDEIPFFKTVAPNSYLLDGWSHMHRPKGGKLSPGKGEKTDYWAGNETAVIRFKLPYNPQDELYITLNLRAPWTPEGKGVIADIHINQVEHEPIQISPHSADTKLIIVKPEAIKDTIEIRLTPTHSWENPIEFTEDTPVNVSFEISAIAAYPSQIDFMESIQQEYNHAHNARYELFDRGLDLLEDRGELVDKIITTIGNLERLGQGDGDTRRALDAFLDDPHILGQDQSKITFDINYFNTHRDELINGDIQREIRLWKHRFDRFHELVVQNGNRAFMQLGEHKPGMPSESPRIRQHLENINLPKDKLTQLKDRNDYLNTLEVLLKRDTLISVVPDLEIEMSSYCNYACVMCGRSWSAFLFVRQSDQQLERLIPVLPYIRHITIAGVGENTSSDKLEVFAKMTNAYDCETRIFTNGSFIHKQLDALSLFNKVCISFDGGTAETFETQRRGAKFDLVVSNIGKLRERAPDIELAFSVVVSRLNLYELPIIAQLAADLGVNHVAFSPVWHKSPMELRPSDKEPFAEQLALAQDIADAGNITLQVNVTPEDFCVAEDEPLKRQEILDFTNAIEFPSLRVPKMAELQDAVEELKVDYHPSPLIFPDRKWPEAPAPRLDIGKSEEQAPIKDFDIDKALEATENAIIEAEAELATQDTENLEIPYCLSIWKYTYLRSNGKNRLCPQAFVDVGNNRRDGFRNVMNGPKNREMRQSMFSDNKTNYCTTCLDPYRRWGHKKVIEQLRDMKLAITDKSRYSVAHEDMLTYPEHSDTAEHSTP